MAAYLIARMQVKNSTAFAQYAERTPQIVAAFGGRYLVNGGAATQVEGAGPDRHVLIEFDDMEAARAFYRSAAFQAVLPVALEHTIRDMVFVEGV